MLRARGRRLMLRCVLGYETYMLVGEGALNVLLFMSAPDAIMPAVQVGYAMVIHSALELMSKQRELPSCGDITTDFVMYCRPEQGFAQTVFPAVLYGGLKKLDKQAANMITAGTWEVFNSDALAMRKLLDPCDPKDTVAASGDAAAAEAAARGLRTCSLASCGSKEAHVSHFKRCSACQQAFYCCREHQLADWPAHKAACKAARKAAAAAPSSQ